MIPSAIRNDRDVPQVRLSYSNAALLEKLNVHIVQDDVALDAPSTAPVEEPNHGAAQHPFGTFRLTDAGAYLMPYEQLINPDAVASQPLHWPWKLVKAKLDELAALGKDYRG